MPHTLSSLSFHQAFSNFGQKFTPFFDENFADRFGSCLGVKDLRGVVFCGSSESLRYISFFRLAVHTCNSLILSFPQTGWCSSVMGEGLWKGLVSIFSFTSQHKKYIFYDGTSASKREKQSYWCITSVLFKPTGSRNDVFFDSYRKP